MPILSIITINRNNKDGLLRTLNSLDMQGYKEFELIVIDGASSDGSQAVVEQHNHLISYAVSEPDNGIYHAMNKGWQKASGEYCIFLNSGDSLVDDKVLMNAIPYLEKADADIFYGNMMGHDKNSSYVSEFKNPPSLIYFFWHYLPHPCTFFKRSLLLKHEGYFEQYRIISDWAFFVTCFLDGASFKHIPLLISNFYTDGISSTENHLAAQEKQTIFNNEFAFLKVDFTYFVKMRGLEMSRPANMVYTITRQLKKWFQSKPQKTT